jgi:phosphonate transport system substrate-binding protein
MKIIISILVLISLTLPVGFALYSDSIPDFIQARQKEKRPLMMGVIPYLQPESLRLQFNPILDYLSIKLNRRVKLITVSDYEALGRLLELDRVSLAWFSDTSYQKLKKNNAWEIICRPYQYGSAVYRGQIIVRQDSKIERIEQLRNKFFAYVDRYSGSGFFYPNLLFKDKGIEPLKFFSSVGFSQSHKNSIIGVSDKTYDAAAVFSVNLAESGFDKDDKELFVRVIAKTRPIPNDPLVVRQDFDSELKKKVTKAMLNMHLDPDGREYIKALTKIRGTEKFLSEAEVEKVIAEEISLENHAETTENIIR